VTVNVVMNPAALAELLRGPNGPVYRMQLENGELVKREAQRLCPVAKPEPGARRARAPGTLRDSIVKRIRQGPEGPIVEVGSEDPVALWVHEGTQPHLIEGNPLLVFFWAKAGRVVAFPRVNHPGNAPNRFLVQALEVLRGRL
jgi:hypothetical protein